MSLAPPNSSPSEVANQDLIQAARTQEIILRGDRGVAAAALTTGVRDGYVATRPCRIIACKGLRQIAGAANSTDVDINVNGVSILVATKMEFEQSAGANAVVDGVLDATLPDNDGFGHVLASGDRVELEIDAVETAAPSGLSVTLKILG